MKCSLEVVSPDSTPIRESAWRLPRVPSLPRQTEADCDHEGEKREGGAGLWRMWWAYTPGLWENESS